MDIPVRHDKTLACAWKSLKTGFSHVWQPKPSAKRNVIRQPKWLEQQLTPVFRLLHADHEKATGNSPAKKQSSSQIDSDIEASLASIDMAAYCGQYSPVEAEDRLNSESGTTFHRSSLSGSTCVSHSDRADALGNAVEEFDDAETKMTIAKEKTEVLEDSVLPESPASSQSDRDNNEVFLPECCRKTQEKLEYLLEMKEDGHHTDLHNLQIDLQGEIDNLRRDHKEALDDLQAECRQELYDQKSTLTKSHKEAIRKVQDRLNKKLSEVKAELRMKSEALDEATEIGRKLQVRHDDSSCQNGVSCVDQNNFLRAELAQLEERSKEEQESLQCKLQVAMTEVITLKDLSEKAQATIVDGERYISQQEARWKIADEGLRQATLLMQADNIQAMCARLLQQNGDCITSLIDENCSRVQEIQDLYRERESFLEEMRQTMDGYERTFGEASTYLSQVEADIIFFRREIAALQREKILLRGENDRVRNAESSLEVKILGLQAAIVDIKIERVGLQKNNDGLQCCLSEAHSDSAELRSENTALQVALGETNKTNQESFAASKGYQRELRSISNLTEQVLQASQDVQRRLKDNMRNRYLRIQIPKTDLLKEKTLRSQRKATFKQSLIAHNAMVATCRKHEVGLSMSVPKQILKKRLENDFLALSVRSAIIDKVKGQTLVDFQAATPSIDHGRSLYKAAPDRQKLDGAMSLTQEQPLSLALHDLSNKRLLDSAAEVSSLQEQRTIVENVADITTEGTDVQASSSHNGDQITNNISTIRKDPDREPEEQPHDASETQPPKPRLSRAERKEAAIKKQAEKSAPAVSTSKPVMSRQERRTKMRALMEESRRIK